MARGKGEGEERAKRGGRREGKKGRENEAGTDKGQRREEKGKEEERGNGERRESDIE